MSSPPVVNSTIQPAMPALGADSRLRPGAQRARRLVVGMVLGLLALAFSALLFDAYSLNIFAQAFLFAMVVVTVDVLWGYSGILSYAQSAFFGIGAYAVGLAFTAREFSPGVAAAALVAGVVLAALVGAAIGSVSFHARASWLFVAVVTFAVPVIFVQLILAGGRLTGSSSGLSGFPTLDLSNTQWYLVLGTLLILLAGAALTVVESDAGRVLKGIRENEERCQYLGLETSRIKTLLLAVCAAVAAGAGALYAMFANVVAPGLGDFVLGSQFVIWAALGGRGTLLGPILATILINVVSARLGGTFPFIWTLFVGILFVVVVIYLPAGLLPAVLGGVRRLRNRGSSRSQVFSTTAGGEATAAQIVVVPRATGAVHTSPDGQQALELRGVQKHFGSLKVLDGVDLQVGRGELLSIIGPNGAGKTTLMRCMSDGRERSAGSVAINGQSIGRGSPQRCVALGLGRKFQTANVFEGLTVRDCLRIARASRERPSLWRSSPILRLPDAAWRVVQTTGLDAVLGVRAQYLSHGMKQALELAMVLAVEPSILLLDEPTAGLTNQERTAIGGVLVDLARSQQLCIVLVEHDLDFVREISTRVLVLHQGKVLLDGTVDEVVESPLVREVYAGTAQVAVIDNGN